MKKSRTFNFDEQTISVIESLREENRLGTKTDVIIKALRLLNVVTAANKKGEVLVIKNPETGKEIEIMLC